MLAYVNGEFVEADQATVSVKDRGFQLGDGVFDVWRTYGGRSLPKVYTKNLARFRRSINYLELDGSAVIAEIEQAAADLVERNQEEINAAGDVWVHSLVTRGVALEGANALEPTRVILCNPIPFPGLFAGGELYERGAYFTSSLQSRNPFLPVDPRVKSTSRLAYVRAERKQVRSQPGTYVVLFDNEGYIVEASAAGFCIVEGETIVRTPRWKALESISLDTFCALGKELGFGVEERPLSTYDLLNADEVHVVATSIAAVPVVDLDGIALKPAGRVGPKILDAWVEYVGFDFRAQARELGRTAVGVTS